MGIFDDQWDYMNPEGNIPTSTEDTSLYKPSRGIFSDVLHGLWSGSGRALKTYGAGLDYDWMKDLGDWIDSTSFARPDKEQYLGTSGAVSDILTGAAESLPTSLPLLAGGMLGGAAGTLAGGPAGTVAGATAGTGAVGAVLAKGIYEEAFDRALKQDPYKPLDEIESYAFKTAAIETLTELASTGVDLFTAKLGGNLTKGAIKSAFAHDLLDVDTFLGAAAKKVGVPTLIAKATGAGSIGGLSEVAADKLQYEVDKSYGFDVDTPDYFKTFMIGLVAEAPMALGATYVENKSQQKIRSNLEKGLKSEDIEQRKHTAFQIYENMYKASPEAASLWSDYVALNVNKGPLDLNSKVLKSASSELNIKKLEEKGLINQITQKPEEILEEAGIPSGSPVVSKTASDIYSGPVSKEVSTDPYGNIKPIERDSTVTGPVVPSWYKPQRPSFKEEAAKVEQYGENITVPVPIADRMKAPSKKTEVPIEPTRPATQKEAQWKKPIYENPKKIEEVMAAMPEDSNTITVEEQKKQETQKVEQAKATRLQELTSKEKLTIKERKELRDLKGTITTPTIVTTRTTPSSKQQTTTTIPSTVKVEKVQQKIVDLQASLQSPEVTDQERVKTQEKIATLEEKIVSADDTIVPKGEVNSVDRTGTKTSVLYPKSNWSKIQGANIYTNGNGVLVKIGNRKWQFLQKDDAGKRVDHGFFKSQSDALTALEEGKTPTEFYPSVEEATTVVPLSEDEKALVSSINPEEVVGKVLAKSALRDDPEASGVVLEAITKAAKNFNKEKGASFKSWAISKAKGAVLDYSKKRAEINRIERQELSKESEGGEGSQREGAVESATKQDIQEPIALKETKEVKETPAEVKKVDVEEYKREQEAIKILNDAKIKGKERLDALRRVRSGEYSIQDLKEAYTTTLEPMERAETKPIGEVRALSVAQERNPNLKVQSTQTVPMSAEEFLKLSTSGEKTIERIREEGFVEKPGKEYSEYEPGSKESFQYNAEVAKESPNPYLIIDKNGKVIGHDGRHRAVFGPNKMEVSLLYEDGQFRKEDLKPQFKQKVPVEADKVPTTPVESDTGIAATARGIFLRNNGDKVAALVEAKAYLDKELRTRLVQAIDKMQLTTTADILKPYLTKENNGTPSGALANLLNRLLKSSGKDNLRILIDPSIRSENYNAQDNIVHLKQGSRDLDLTPLHELGHAITVRELISNPAIRQEVLDLMKIAENKAVDVGLLTKKDVEALHSLPDRTSKAFKDRFPISSDELDPEARVLMYSFLNEFEFMAQVMDRPSFMTFLQQTEIPVGKEYKSFLSRGFKTLYDALISIVQRVFKIPGTREVQNNVAKRVLELYGELSKQDVTNWKEGQISYGQDVLLPAEALEPQRKTMDERFKIMRKNEVSLKDTPKEWVVKQFKTVKDGIKNYAQSTVERLRQIAPPIANGLRKMEWKISEYNQKYHDQVSEFISRYQDLNTKDRLLLDLSLKNAEDGNDYAITRDEILNRNMMMESYKKVQEVLADIYQRKDAQGLNKHNTVADYFPRRVKDIDGLRQAMKNDGSYGVIEAQIDGLTSEADKELAITSMINTGRMPPLAFKDPTSSKARKITTVSSSWNHFYDNSMDALINHIYESNEAIESRAMFGGAKRKQQVELREELYSKLNSKKEGSAANAEIVRKINNIESWLDRHPEEEFFEGISNYLAENAIDLSPKDQSDVIKLLRGRLTQKGMSGALAVVRNLSLMSVLGNPMSAITQMGDMVFSLNDAGLKSTLKSMFGDKTVTAKDLDLAHSMREFQSGTTARWLDGALRNFGIKGLEKISMSAVDKFGKELYMNSVIDKAKRMSLADFKEQWGSYLEEYTEETYNDIKEGKKTENVKFFAFNALSEVQPISMSEMPLKYLTAGNGRLLYALKSYNIKLLNNIYKRMVYNYQSTSTPIAKKAAIKDVSRLLVLVTLAGASMDELKDFIMGREGANYSDRVMDNLLKMVMVNRYALNKAEKDGFFKSIVGGTLLPPFQLVDDPIKDMQNLLNPDKESTFYSVRNLPVIGKMYYEWFTSTSEGSSYTNLKTKVLESYKEGSSIGSLRGKMNKYNSWARRNKKPLITYKTLNAAKKRKE